MKDLVIGDVHFGIKVNNIAWLEQQIKYFSESVIPLVKDHDRVVILGDLFDIRYSVNTQVGIEVKNMMRILLREAKGKDVWVIAGNHDFYSPSQEFEHYNAYELVFGDEFCTYWKNFHTVTQLPVCSGRALFLPWYFTENEEMYEAAIKEYKNQYDVIYCHTDLEHWTEGQALASGGVPVISGHIHYPWVDYIKKLYNIGACCSFTFNDVNSSRYIYTIEDGKIISKYENTTTPKFKRFYNERILSIEPEDTKNNYVQLYINDTNAQKAQYIEKIAEIKKEYPSMSPIKVFITNEEEMADNATSGMSFTTNIFDYMSNNMPEHLEQKFNSLTEKIEHEQDV